MSSRPFIIAILITLSSILMLQEDGHAQKFEGPPDSTRIAAIVDTLAKRLSLADSVKVQVFGIYYESAAESRAILQQNKLNLRAKMKLQSIANKRDEQVKKLLTKEQQKEYDKIVDEQREKMKARLRERQQGL